MGIKFDTVVVATGSGGTAAGLYLANELHGYGKRVVSMAVCDDIEYFTNIIENISNGALAYLPEYKDAQLKRENIEVIDKYVGLGYAISRPEELEFIKHVAQKEAVILDPVYTGKAMYGVYNELKEGGALVGSKNILFIHTGGLFGLFPVSEQFEW